MKLSSVNRYFGNIELYLMDQILKQRFHVAMKVLDAGCGEGRNLTYFLNAGFTVYAVDKDPSAVEALRFIAASLRPDLGRDCVLVADLENLPYPDRSFDLILCCQVLHCAGNQDQFFLMFDELVRCLKPGGVLFISMASSIGIKELETTGGPNRFLLTRNLVKTLKGRYELNFLEPMKTVNIEDTGCTSILVLSAPG